MVKNKVTPSGWREKPDPKTGKAPRHREVALHGQYKDIMRTPFTIPKLIEKTTDVRTKKSTQQDQRKTSKNVLDSKKPLDVLQWSKSPNRFDLEGVDTKTPLIETADAKKAPEQSEIKNDIKSLPLSNISYNNEGIEILENGKYKDASFIELKNKISELLYGGTDLYSKDNTHNSMIDIYNLMGQRVFTIIVDDIHDTQNIPLKLDTLGKEKIVDKTGKNRKIYFNISSRDSLALKLRRLPDNSKKTVMPFGKNKGRTIEEMLKFSDDVDYLFWLSEQGGQSSQFIKNLFSSDLSQKQKINLELDLNNNIIIRAPYEFKEECQNLSIRTWDSNLKGWIVPLSILPEVLENFTGYEEYTTVFSPALKKKIEDIKIK